MSDSYKRSLSISPNFLSQKSTPRLSMSTGTPVPIKTAIMKKQDQKNERERDLGKYKALFNAMGEYSLRQSFRTEETINGNVEKHNLVLGTTNQLVNFFVQIEQCNGECNNKSLTPLLSSLNQDDHMEEIEKMCDLLSFSKVFTFYPHIGLIMKNTEEVIFKVFCKEDGVFYSSVYQENPNEKLAVNPGEYHLLIFSDHLDKVIKEELPALESDPETYMFSKKSRFSISPEVVNLISLNVSKYSSLFNTYDKYIELIQIREEINELSSELEKKAQRLINIQDVNSPEMTDSLLELSNIRESSEEVINCVREKMKRIYR